VKISEKTLFFPKLANVEERAMNAVHKTMNKRRLSPSPASLDFGEKEFVSKAKVPFHRAEEKLIKTIENRSEFESQLQKLCYNDYITTTQQAFHQTHGPLFKDLKHGASRDKGMPKTQVIGDKY